MWCLAITIVIYPSVDTSDMKALIVVDYQNDYVTGPLGHKFAKMIENNICDRIEDTLDQKGDVFFLVDSYGTDYEDTLEGKRNPVRHCIRGLPGEELHGKVGDYLNKGHIIRKQTPGSEELYKRIARYDEIEICGLEMNRDILVNAIIAQTSNPKATITIRQNCVASKDSLLGEEAMDILTSLGIVFI